MASRDKGKAKEHPNLSGDSRMRVDEFYGRRFGSYKRGQWLFPVDELEQDRLDIFFNVLKNVRNQQLYDAPISFTPTSTPDERPRGYQILDLGTGSGLWPTVMADKYPEVVICGVDLYDNQHPKEVVPGRTYFTGGIDIEDDWKLMDDFFEWASTNREELRMPRARLDPMGWDLIRACMLNGGIRSWPDVYQKIIKHLKPGTGYVELIEIDWVPRCDDGTMKEHSDYRKWAEDLLSIMDAKGRSMRIDPYTKDHLEKAGFTDVQERKIKLLCNPWRNTDSQEELVARWFNLGLTYGLEGMSMGPFMRERGMSRAQFNEMLKKVRYESCLLRHHLYCYVYVWTARRPANT